MFLGHEQVYHPGYSILEKVYIALFGVPIVGLRIRARNVFSLIPKNRKYRNILDAGSGPGVFTFELGRRFPEAKVVGIDLKKGAIEACTNIIDKTRVTNVSFRQIPIEELTKKPFFDLIICVDILEHIKNDLTALQGLSNSIAEDGILVLHVPSLYRRYPVWKKALNFDVDTHVRAGYEQEEIREKVKQVGFSVREIGFTYGFWETLANNLSYMITGARKQNKILYSLAFPLLNIMSLLGTRARPANLGAGIFIIAEKGLKHGIR